MTLKRIVERGEKVETFEVLQIYMILKRHTEISTLNQSFWVLQIYMTLKCTRRHRRSIETS